MSVTNRHWTLDNAPEDILSRLQSGDTITLAISREGEQVVVREIDPDQAWFWTPEWQAGERETDEDIAAGRVTRYFSDEEFLAALESDLEPPST